MYCILNEKFDNNCVSVLLRFCHRYMEFSQFIKAPKLWTKMRKWQKEISLSLLKRSYRARLILAILKFKSNCEFKMRAFSPKHFKMNTNIIVS